MKISVITVCRNSEKTIKETVLSVVGQSYNNIEYIIIDGNSDDNTLKAIDEYRESIAVVVSENDEGIYDAMNKGIDLATGDYIFFLNADDRFVHNKVIELAVNAFSPASSDIIYGDILFLDIKSGSVSLKRQNKINKIYVYKNVPCQPSVFYNKSVFAKCGKFRTDNRIVSDFDWMLNAILRHTISLQYIGIATTLFSSGGISSSRHDLIHDQERSSVFKEYFSSYERITFSFISRYFRALTTIPVVSYLLNLVIEFELKNHYIDVSK